VILKKSLGQHFLTDEDILNKIVAALQQRPYTQLLEVGPGGGALTKHLVAIPNISFKAVEIDDEKAKQLPKYLPSTRDKIIHESFLNIDPPFDGPFTLIGNFPYNISTEILFKSIEWKNQVETIIGMFQKEVAQRVAAPAGSKVYGVISVLIQAFYDVEYLFDVPPKSFNPPPKVMSGVIRLSRSATPLAVKSDRAFKVLVKTAFNQRRKMLRNAVKSLFDEATLQDAIFNKRAEQLTKEDFAQLSFKML
jgi:16S rRNA (adenine1518-N6/adenine1519-N6)-dimethyltransferase